MKIVRARIKQQQDSMIQMNNTNVSLNNIPVKPNIGKIGEGIQKTPQKVIDDPVVMYMSDNSDGRYVTNQSHISKTAVKKKHNESTVISRLLEDDQRRKEKKKNFE